MTLMEYIGKYHPNKRLKKPKEPTWNSELFYYDDIILDEASDEEIKIIYVDDRKKEYVSLEDIFDIPREEFGAKYNSEKALALRDNYIKNYSILYGEDVILEMQKDAQKRREELLKYEELDFNMLGL